MRSESITLKPRETTKISLETIFTSYGNKIQIEHVWRKIDDDDILSYKRSNLIYFTLKGKTVNSENNRELLRSLKTNKV